MSSSVPFHLKFLRVSPEPGTHLFSKNGQQVQGVPLSLPFQVAGITGTCFYCGFHIWAQGESKLSLHTCMANTLMTELFPHVLKKYFCGKELEIQALIRNVLFYL